MIIELKEHAGRTATGEIVGGFDHIHLIENGKSRLVGYVFDRKNGPIHLIAYGLSESTKAEIRNHIFGQYLGPQQVQEPSMPLEPIEIT